MAEEIDFEAIRHRVKLLEDTGTEQLFENRDGVPCPACQKPFTEALVTTERTCQLSPEPSVDICVAQASDQIIVLTHA